jgi:GNAT superfamily N-acetyltransferase
MSGVRDGILHYLEMRAPSQLRPSLQAVPDVRECRDPSVVRGTTLAVGAPYGWPSQRWDDSTWAAYLARSDIRHWTAHRDNQVVGLASLRFADHETEIDTFGLVPTAVGAGLGGAFLSRIIRIAWRVNPSAERLWLHTSSGDHVHALGNYVARGFEPFDPEQG